MRKKVPHFSGNLVPASVLVIAQEQSRVGDSVVNAGGLVCFLECVHRVYFLPFTTRVRHSQANGEPTIFVILRKLGRLLPSQNRSLVSYLPCTSRATMEAP
jgi:hypothetical protein